MAGCGAYLPERIITNCELADRLDTSDEWIRQRTGIDPWHTGRLPHVLLLNREDGLDQLRRPGPRAEGDSAPSQRDEHAGGDVTAAQIHLFQLCQQAVELAERLTTLHTSGLGFLCPRELIEDAVPDERGHVPSPRAGHLFRGCW